VFPEVEKYAYQENVSCNAKKLDNAGEKAGQFSEMTGSFFIKAYRICRSKSYR
jgi:hypothetical protein